MILKAQALHIDPRIVREIQRRHGIVFLQCNIGGFAVRRHRNVLRFQILGGGSILLEQHAVRNHLFPIEILKGDGLRFGFVKIHHGDGALGVDGVPTVALPGLAFVGCQDLTAVRGKGQHVRLYAGVEFLHERSVIVQQDDGAVFPVIAVLHRDGHQISLGIHIHAGDIPGAEAVELAHERHVDPLDQTGAAVFVDLCDVHFLGLTADQVHAVIFRVELDDLRYAAILIGCAGSIAVQILQQTRFTLGVHILGKVALCLRAVDGEGVHHGQFVVADPVGDNAEAVIGHVYPGDIRGFLLIFHRRIGEFHVLDVIVLAARSGVGGHIQHALRVGHGGGGIAAAVAVFIVVRRRHRSQPIHDVTADIDMVMTHQHYINAQLVEHRHQSIPAGQNILFYRMAGHRVNGVVEGDHLPADVLSFGGPDGLLHEFFVFRRRQIIAVEHHEKGVMIDKVVVAAGIGNAQRLRLVSHMEVIVVGAAGGVVVAHHGGHGHAVQLLMLQISAVLCLVSGGIDLIARTEDEVRSCKIRIRGNFVQGLAPVFSIVSAIAGGADLGIAHKGEGEAIAAAGGKGVNIGQGRTILHLVGIGGVLLQIGCGSLVAVVTGLDRSLAFRLKLASGVGHCTRHYLVRLRQQQDALGLYVGVPCEVHFALIGAHGQIDTRLLLRHDLRLFCRNLKLGHIEPHIGAARPPLMDFHGEDVFAPLQIQIGQIILRKGHRLGRRSVGATVLQIRGDFTVIIACHLYAVNVYGSRIIILERAGQVFHVRGIVHREAVAEEVGIGIVFAITACQQVVCGIALFQCLFSLFGTEAAACSIPLGIVVIHCGPAGTLIALSSAIPCRISIIVQIGPRQIRTLRRRHCGLFCDRNFRCCCVCVHLRSSSGHHTDRQNSQQAPAYCAFPFLFIHNISPLV